MRLTSRLKISAGNILFRFQDSVRFYRLKKSGTKPLAVLMYHGLETDPRRLEASCHRVTPEGCLNEIRFFERQGYRLISAREIDSLQDRNGDDHAGYLLVSFDDGHANIFPYVKEWMKIKKLPVLLGVCPGIIEENGIYWWEEVKARFDLMRQPTVQIRSSNGTVRIFAKADRQQFEQSGRASCHEELQSSLDQLRQQTGYITRRELRNSPYVHENMNWQQVMELSRHPLCTIASHSMHHEIATQLPGERLRGLTEASLELLEAWTGCRTEHYIYPNGAFSGETEHVLASLGIRHTYSTEGVLNSIPAATRLNRLNGYDFENRGLRHYGALWRKRHMDYTRAQV